MVKNPSAMPETPSLIPGSGRYPGGGIGYPLQYSWASLVVQLVKNLPAVQETWVRFLGWEDPLEKEMATHSGILAWRIPWTEEPGRVSRVRHDLATEPQPPALLIPFPGFLGMYSECDSVSSNRRLTLLPVFSVCSHRRGGVL